MNIQELQLERDALQKRLRVKIQEELDSFVAATGIYVDSAYINLESVYFLYKEKPEYRVENVKVNLDL